MEKSNDAILWRYSLQAVLTSSVREVLYMQGFKLKIYQNVPALS